MLDELFKLFRSHDPLPFVMLAFVAVGWVVVLERIILLQIVYRVNFKKFNVNIRKMLSAGDLERARTLCSATSKTGVPQIAVKAIDAFQTDSFKVRTVVSEEVLSFLPRIRRRLSQLPNLATATVLIGALAAVRGIWSAFHAADVIDFSVKSAALTNGLASAFTPLSFALIGCVTLMLPYGILDSVATRLENEVEHSLTIITNILAPETSTVITHSGMMAADSGMQSASVSTPEAPSAAEQTTESKGNYEDVLANENTPVLDEEEII